MAAAVEGSTLATYRRGGSRSRQPFKKAALLRIAIGKSQTDGSAQVGPGQATGRH